MHELGIVFHTIRTIEEVAAEQGLTRVGSVTLELGEVSGAIPQELVSCWDWAVNRTELLRGAPLKIETLPAVTQQRQDHHPAADGGAAAGGNAHRCDGGGH